MEETPRNYAFDFYQDPDGVPGTYFADGYKWESDLPFCLTVDSRTFHQIYLPRAYWSVGDTRLMRGDPGMCSLEFLFLKYKFK